MKTHFIEELGQGGILLPSLVAEGQARQRPHQGAHERAVGGKSAR
jgi:hypothetical protein